MQPMTEFTPEQRRELLGIQHDNPVRHEPIKLIWMPERERDPFPRWDYVAVAGGDGFFVLRSGTARHG